MNNQNIPLFYSICMRFLHKIDANPFSTQKELYISFIKIGHESFQIGIKSLSVLMKTNSHSPEILTINDEKIENKKVYPIYDISLFPFDLKKAQRPVFKPLRFLFIEFE